MKKMRVKKNHRKKSLQKKRMGININTINVVVVDIDLAR